MLSFREVHIGDTAIACTPTPQSPSFYRPGAISWGTGDTGAGSGSSPGSASPSQQSLFYVATCPASLVAGQAVYVVGDNAVDVADCSQPNIVVGIATSKKSDTTVVVQTAGYVVLGLSGLSPGVDYFLGHDGMLVAPPVTGILFVQRVGVAADASSLYLQPSGTVIRQAVG